MPNVYTLCVDCGAEDYTVSVTSTPSTGFTKLVTDSPIITGTSYYVWVHTATSAATITSSFSFTSGPDVIETVTTTSTPVRVTDSSYTSQTEITGEGTPGYLVTATSQSTIVSTPVSVLDAVYTSSAAVTSVAADSNVRTITAVSSVTATDTPEPGYVFTASSSQATATSTATHNVEGQQSATSQATITAAEAIALQYVVSQTSQAAITAAEAIQIEYSLDETTIVEIDDLFTIVDPNATAWVLNVENLAATTYSNFQANSLFQTRSGAIFVVGPAGISLMTGGTDSGQAIDAEAVLGFTDFGDAHSKRMEALYMGYTGGPLSFGVEASNSGSGESHTYDIMFRDVNIPANTRGKPGKGLNGRYWRLTLRNVDGADFEVDSLSADLAFSNRRL